MQKNTFVNDAEHEPCYNAQNDFVEVLFEDEFLICCVKPYGVLSQSDGTKKCMATKLAKYRQSKGESPYIGTIHRLDKTTGGVMLYSKTQQMTAALSETVRNSQLDKTYLVVTQGVPEQASGELVDYLFHDIRKNKSYIAKKERRGVKRAVLSYILLNTKIIDEKPCSLLKIKLHTGRTHQIRVQFASRKMPLLGDRKYGSGIPLSNIMLWSYSLEFVHPITKKKITAHKNPSNENWDIFKGVL